MWVDVYWTGPEKEYVGEHRARVEQRRILEERILQNALNSEGAAIQSTATRGTPVQANTNRSTAAQAFSARVASTGRFVSHGSSVRAASARVSSARVSSARVSSAERSASTGSSANDSSTQASSAQAPSTQGSLTRNSETSRKVSLGNFLKALAGKKRSKKNEEEGENTISLSARMKRPGDAQSLPPVSDDGTMDLAFIADTSSIYSEPGPPEPELTPSELDDASAIENLEPSAHLAQRVEIYQEMTPYDEVSDVGASSDHESDQPKTPSTATASKNANWPSPPIDSPIALVPGLKIPSGSENHLGFSFKPNDRNAWRTAEEWESAGEPPEPRKTSVESLMEKVDQHLDEFGQDIAPTVELNMFKEDVKQMALTSPKAIVARLKEIDLSNADRIIGEELDKERNQWMLSILHHLDLHGGKEPRYKRFRSGIDGSSEKAPKLLTLYESGSTTEYLAAIHSDKKVYHMSSDPLSHTDFPNVRSVLLPSTAAFSFPFASQTFDFVYSHSISSRFPADEMLGILKKISKALKPNGVMFLTVIDPLPVKWSLGPLMKAWLDENLMVNLEKRGLCTEPMLMFTEWMGEAKLRGSGSIAHASTSLAFSGGARPQRFLEDPFVEGDLVGHKENEEKEELRTMVGHTLWMEIWGPYVACDIWWWEMPDIVEECMTLKTFWRYHQIEGVKDSKTKKF